MSTLSVRECIKFGWATFKGRPWFYVGVTLLIGVLQVVIGSVQESLPEFLGFIASLALSTLVYVGTINLFLKAHDGEGKTGDLWHPAAFWSYLGLSVLLFLIVGLGLVLLIVPGIILALAFFCAGYLVVDKNLTPIKALKESYRITKGKRWKLFLLVLASAGLMILGMFPLFLGLLVAAPVCALAGVHAYRTIAG